MLPGDVEIHCDGSCPNVDGGGPGGYCAILRMVHPKTGELHERVVRGHVLRGTNQRLELLAALNGLLALTRPTRVTVISDSEYLVNAFAKGWLEKWQRKGWRTSSGRPVANRDLWTALVAEDRKHTSTWKWVRGHAGDPLNEAADHIAVEERDRAREKIALGQDDELLAPEWAASVPPEMRLL